MNVSATRIFTSGRSTPNARSTTSRYSQVKKVLISEIQNCANTTRWNAVPKRAACRAIASVSGRRSMRIRCLLHGEQRADDHAHEHVHQRAADAAPGELQCARVRPQPFGDRAPEGFGVFGNVGLQPGRKNGARILDDLRHLLHEQRHALAAVAQSATRPTPMPMSAAITAEAISVTASTRGPSRPSARRRNHGVSTSTSLKTSRPASSADSRCSSMMRPSATATMIHAAMSARVTGVEMGTFLICSKWDGLMRLLGDAAKRRHCYK